MRHLLNLVIIMLVSVNIYPFSYYNYNLQDPPQLVDSCNISLYRTYIDYIFSDGDLVILPGGHTYSGYSSDTIGVWRMSNDTLLIYENYFSEGQEKDMTQKELEYYSKIFYCGDWHRWIVNYLDTWGKDYPFPSNVSALKVKNYGDRIIKMPDADRVVCYYIPASFYEAASKYTFHDWLVFKGDIWQFYKMDWRQGEFLVRKKTERCKQTLIVDIEKDGILFRIVNPKYYLKHDTVKYYDPDDEHALSGWMDSVEIGRRYRFVLQRPDYPADSASHVRYLRTLPDSIYISSPIARSTEPLSENHEQFPDTCREAYGYFFARMMR